MGLLVQGAPIMEAQEVDSDLGAAAAGDRGAFTRLVRRHQARVYSLALRLTGRREDAEELAQDTFLRLHADLVRIRTDSHLQFWLYRTVTHRSIDRLRRLGRELPVMTVEAAASGSAAMTAPAVEEASDPLLARRLRELLLGLPAMARATVVLRYQEDLDPLEIARLLDVPINTVKSHLRRSLEWLRTHADLEAGHGP